MEISVQARHHETVRPEIGRLHASARAEASDQHEVLRKATEAVEGDEGETIFLGHDAQVLRAIATDQTELLIWVNGSIEILLPNEKPGDLLSADRGTPGMEFVSFTNKDEAMDFFASMFGAADDDEATDEVTDEGDDTPNTEAVNDR